MWGTARARGARVLLRVEDHDRQRSRPAYDAALLEDLAWLGFEPDEGPVRQSDDPGPYAAALDRLRTAGVVYACQCSRADVAATAFAGPGCPQGCRDRRLAERPGLAVRVALGGGSEAWMDRLVGPVAADVAGGGDPPVRDRDGNWTYAFAVVVDDLRQGVDLVIRGRDLLEATAAQIRLGRLLGRAAPPAFLHHPLVHKASGAKLSKADADTAVRDLRSGGAAADELIGRAASAVGLIDQARPIRAEEVVELFR